MLVAKALGFVEKLLLAYYAGVSAEVDAYFTAFGIAFFFFVIIDDILVPVFLARYVLLRERCGSAEAYRFAKRVGVATFMILLPVAVSVGIWAEPLLQLITPGFDAEQRDRTAALIRWILPGGLVMGLAALTYVLLNAHERYAWPALAGAVFKAVTAIGIFLLMREMGIAGAAVAVCAAAVVQFTLHLIGVRLWVRPAIQTIAAGTRAPPQLRSMILLMIPLAVGTLASQGSSFVDNACGSMLPAGSIAALGYARRLVDLPILLIPGALGIVAFPKLAKLAARHDTRGVMTVTVQLIEFCLIVFLPICAVCLLEPESLVRLTFARGEFGESAVVVTGLALLVFSIGLVAYAIEIPLLRTYYAFQDTLTPTLVGLVFLGINIAMTILLTPRLGIVAIPLALSTQKTLKVLTLLLILVRRFPGAWLSRLLNRAWRIIPCAGVFAIIFALCATWTGLGSTTEKADALVSLVLSTAAASTAYLAALLAARLLHWRDMVRFARGARRRLP